MSGIMKLLHVFDPFDWSDTPLTEIKYKLITPNLLNRLDPNIRFIVEKMMEFDVDCGSYDRRFLDVKVRFIKPNQFSCALTDFHYDWVKEFDFPIPHETHFIYSNVNGTEFEHDKCVDNGLYTYNRELHRGVRNEQPEVIKRVLIRLSYVNDRLKG